MKVISLFSGAGGLDLGFIQAGHKVVWANDNDPDAVATYRENIGNHIVLNDLQYIEPSNIPDGDLVIGGFPCQGFSCANMLRCEEDKRNLLYLEFLKILRSKAPKFFLAENVRGILSLDGGRVFKMILRDFSNVGYNVRTECFNMADFGVPQNRFRVIMVGLRDDLHGQLRFEFPIATHSKHPENGSLKPWITIGQALHGIPEPNSQHTLLNHVHSRYKVTNRNFTGHRRTNPDKPSPTILARGNGKGGVCAIQHPLNHRRLTVRESAIIQTFPLDFYFHGRLNSMYRQVGNAVPVRFSYLLGRRFREIEEQLSR